MAQQYLVEVRKAGQTVNPLFVTLDVVLARAEEGEAELRMPVTMRLCQGGGMVAGGILATLADEAMAHAVISILGEGQRAVTAEMNIRYLRGADPGQGGELRASARLIKRGRQICVAEAEVHDSHNRLLVVAGASFYLLREAS